MEQKKDSLAMCGGCAHHDKNTQHQPVPYIVHERDMARTERNNKRLWILCIVMFLAFAASNAAWVWYESQFEQFETTITQDNADGYNNYIGNDGDIMNGTPNN